MFKSFDEALSYLEERSPSSFGLKSIETLLSYLGDPEKDLKFIHIAGTNGKGSLVAYLTAALDRCGYTVGRYSSPAVFNVTDIIGIGRDNISRDDFLKYMNIIASVLPEMKKKFGLEPTRFEMETAIAFMYFKEKRADIVVLETGLGGRLDATNIVKDTLISAFVSISYDHMGILGNSLREIAEEKAGIIKENSIVISVKQEGDVEKVLWETAKEKKSAIYFASKGEFMGGDVNGQVISYKGREFPTKLIGEHQLENLPLAIEVLRTLKRMGYSKIGDLGVKEGIESATWNARCEVIGKDPIFIIDGAHNERASAMLSLTLKRYFPDKRLIFIMGIFKDKDVRQIVENTVDLASEVITFDWEHERKLGGEKLKEIVSQYMDNAHFMKNAREAVKYALESADSNSVIVAFGSLSHLKEIKAEYKRYEEDNYGRY
ncbi:MAG: bifunctional folylpolyglutamate synthase/dihydrofolate synthase [Clostridia bacterium]|nr:bifunctional folylpolyglutamate synthase/dihydrofolate synthase [Clostridia bacterium]MCX4367659.1 Mur ligase family protein [Clostridia bacterium]